MRFFGFLAEACRLATSVGGYAGAMVALIEPGMRTARPTAWAGSADSQLMQRLKGPGGEARAIAWIVASKPYFDRL